MYDDEDARQFKLSIYLPRWLAKFLFPATYRDLKRRSALTGTAGKVIHDRNGSFISTKVHFSLDDKADKETT